MLALPQVEFRFYTSDPIIDPCRILPSHRGRRRGGGGGKGGSCPPTFESGGTEPPYFLIWQIAHGHA